MTLLGASIIGMLTSCTNATELERLVKENEILKTQNDSLIDFASQFEAVSIILPQEFNIQQGETYVSEQAAVIKNGVRLDSLFIDDLKIDPSDSLVSISQGFFGPRIEFKSTDKGTYEFKSYISSAGWGFRSIKTEWSIKVD